MLSKVLRGGALRSVGSSGLKRHFLASLTSPTKFNFSVTQQEFDLDEIFHSEDKLLLTPGPLSTSQSVRQYATRDFGSRDPTFINLVSQVRQGILDIENLSNRVYTSILMQGSGTFCVESAIQTSVPRNNGNILIITNGSYGDRAGIISQQCGINTKIRRYYENEFPDLEEIKNIISNESFTNIFMVHSETTSGIINPIEELGNIIKENSPNSTYIVDAMSSFGGIPIDLEKCNIDFLVTSANKCIQGIPGFGIVIARINKLNDCKGNSRSLSLDLYDQYKGLESNGQFRFTPPTHAICAFQKALNELKEEGGVKERSKRYKKNQEIVIKTVEQLGFEQYLDEDKRGYIISSIKYPNSPNWNFELFYNKLAEKGYLIYPGKVTNADCFRIGHIGNIMPENMESFSKHFVNICNEMKLF